MRYTAEDARSFVEKRLDKYRRYGSIDPHFLARDVDDTLRSMQQREGFYIHHDKDENVIFVGLTVDTNGRLLLNWQDTTWHHPHQKSCWVIDKYPDWRLMEKMDMYRRFGIEYIGGKLK